MAYLNEPQAWREIAKRVATRGLKQSGLCSEVDALWESSALDVGVWADMRKRVRYHCFGGTWAVLPCAWNDGGRRSSESARIRVLAALMLAHESEEG